MNTHIKRYRTKHERRVVRSRARVANSLLPRLAVFRSNKYMFAQVIMPDGKAVAGVRHAEATKAGELLAEKAIKAGVEKVVFDRSGYKYHGRVKAVAEAARAGGLKF